MGRTPSCRAAGAVVLAALLGAGSGAAAGATDAALPAGEVVERVPCLSDPEFTYAAYLPSGYAAGRNWPILFVMDPRGRALLALERFREAAERLGYIVVSSYDTRSDVPRDRNIQSIKAMLPDAERRFSINTRRLYLTGFSGTARTAWVLGYALKGHVAGLLGFGGGLPSPFDPGQVRVAFFGGAGTTDFNFEEMRQLDRRLDDVSLPHRFVVWEGPHSWPPAEVCGQGLEWMELQAMASRLRAKDDDLIQALLEQRLAEARSREAAGDLHGAFQFYRAIAEDFAGLSDDSGAKARADELGESKAVRRTIARMERLESEHDDYEARFWAWLQDLKRRKEVHLSRAPATLRIPALQRRAASQGDPLDARAAQQLLEMVFTQTSFYQPRELLEAGRPDAALAMARIAGEIKPGHPRACYQRARALTQLGRVEEALQALGCVVDAGAADAAFLEADPYLEPLRREQGYRELLQRLGGPSVSE
jgi:predicted esterase